MNKFLTFLFLMVAVLYVVSAAPSAEVKRLTQLLNDAEPEKDPEDDLKPAEQRFFGGYPGGFGGGYGGYGGGYGGYGGGYGGYGGYGGGFGGFPGYGGYGGYGGYRGGYGSHSGSWGG